MTLGARHGVGDWWCGLHWLALLQGLHGRKVLAEAGCLSICIDNFSTGQKRLVKRGSIAPRNYDSHLRSSPEILSGPALMTVSRKYSCLSQA